MQIWPEWLNDPNAPTDTAFSRSTSSSTISAELPPSSRCTRLSRFAACSAMILPGAGGAGEGDDPDQRVVDHRRADVRATGQHVEQPRRQPGLLEDPGEHHPAAHRGAGVGLEHHRVAQRQRRGDGPDRQDDRGVERRDHPDHADRQPPRHRQPRLVRPQHLAVRVARQPGGLPALLGGHGAGLEPGERPDRAGLADQPLVDLVLVLDEQLARPPQHRPPAGRRAGPPTRAGPARRPRPPCGRRPRTRRRPGRAWRRWRARRRRTRRRNRPPTRPW